MWFSFESGSTWKVDNGSEKADDHIAALKDQVARG